MFEGMAYVVVQDMKRMTSLHQASLHELKRVKKVCGGAGHEGAYQPVATSYQASLHEINRVKGVRGGAE